jgi:hypothetical protein
MKGTDMKTVGMLTALLVILLGVLDLAAELSGGQLTRTGGIASGVVLCLCGITAIIAMVTKRT